MIERAILLCRSDAISINDLPHTFRESISPLPEFLNTNDLDISAWKGKTLSQVSAQVLNHIEKRYIEMVLNQTRGKVGEAAKIAGIHPRGLYGKMKKLGLDKNDFKSNK